MSLIRGADGYSSLDVRTERIHSGTLGGDHMVPSSIGANRISSIVPVTDPTINYYSPSTGLTVPSITFTDTTFDYNGTLAYLANANDTITYSFSGQAIGILAQKSRNSGGFLVYIDGVLTPGRVLTNTELNNNAYALVATHTLNATDTSIYLNTVTSFPTSGTILIDDELITYTSLTIINTVQMRIDGCTRGALGSAPAVHSLASTAYVWSSSVSLSLGAGNTNYAIKQLVWTNSHLSPGNHTIKIVSFADANTGYPQVLFNGFVVGHLLGSGQVFHNVASITLTGTFDANGYANIGGLSTRREVELLGIVAYDQTTPDPIVGNKLAIPILRKSDSFVEPLLSLVGGPANASFVYVLLLSYIGESL